LEFNSNNKSLNEKKHKVSICKKCGKEFKYTKGKIYCSDECREADKNYPSKDSVIEQYNILGSWEKVAKHFSLTRKIINRIRKKKIVFHSL